MNGLIVEQDGTVSDVHRRRERNVERGVAVINDSPVEVQLDWLRPLSPEQQMRGVTTLLSNTRTGLLAAIAANDLPGIAEGKRRASAIQEIAKQLRLSREIQDDAMEFVRRAERGLGVAIRDGQESGTVTKRGIKTADCSLVGPSDFMTNAQMFGDGRGPNANGIYAMTDGVSDEDFEAALQEARSEGKLSRANVARKCKAKAHPEAESQPANSLEPKKKVRKTASARRVMENLAIDINSLVFVINETDPQEVDAEQHKSDIADIRAGLGVIQKFLTKIEKERAAQ